MKRLCTCSMWLTAVAALVVFSAVPGMAQATGTVSVDFQDTPIQAALETLFRGTGYSYTLEPGEGRAVTLSLRDVPFTGALQATLRAAGLVYRVEDGVYAIRPQGSTNRAGSAPYAPPSTSPAVDEVELPPAEIRVEKVPLNFADAFDISDMFGAEQFTSRGNAFATGGGGSMYGFGSTGSGGYGMPGFNTYGYGGYGGSSGSGGLRTGGFGGYGGYGNTLGGNSSGYGGLIR